MVHQFEASIQFVKHITTKSIMTTPCLSQGYSIAFIHSTLSSYLNTPGWRWALYMRIKFLEICVQNQGDIINEDLKYKFPSRICSQNPLANSTSGAHLSIRVAMTLYIPPCNSAGYAPAETKSNSNTPGYKSMHWGSLFHVEDKNYVSGKM